jgi:molybdopterin/thiamine biosynthesis adenylyltransferase
MTRLLVLVPTEAIHRIRTAGAWGSVTFRVSDAENVGCVQAISDGDGTRFPASIEPKGHFLNSCDARPGGYWYRVKPELHMAWADCLFRSTRLTLAGFTEFVLSGFKSPGGGTYIAITHAPDFGEHFPDLPLLDLVAWHVSAAGVEPVDVECQPETFGMQQLAAHWPVGDLVTKTVMLVGAGSIGGAAAHALASYGIGRLLLVDHDRLRWHNLARHVSGSAHIGQLKVSGLREELQRLRPQTTVEAHPLNVVADADQVRALLTRTSLVMCAVDGVAPRRVISHLARRAGLDAILACVLEDGGLGEVLRLRPWKDRGCLVCQRQALAADGGIDPEPTFDAGYGMGTRHRPMTAVGGDLHLVGQLAAKVAIATILESTGHPDQRAPNDHALVALRPQSGWAPPFDLRRLGEIKWLPAYSPLAGCPTCEDP